MNFLFFSTFSTHGLKCNCGIFDCKTNYESRKKGNGAAFPKEKDGPDLSWSDWIGTKNLVCVISTNESTKLELVPSD